MGEVCVSLAPETVEEGLADAGRAARSGAGLIEFRLDRLVRGSDVERLFDSCGLPSIASCRFPRDGGVFRGGLEDRRTLLMRALQGGADWVDVEHWETWEPVVEPGQRTIRSFHDTKGTPRDLAEVQSRLLSFGPDLVKIATTAWDFSEVGPIVALWRQDPPPVPLIAFAMGRRGSPTRLLCLRYGAPFTFSSLGDGGALAPGQLPVQEMLGLYHAREIGPATRIFGLLGNPVAHSLSPALHNRSLRQLGQDAVYLPIETDRPVEVVGFFGPHEWGGLSVTAPHKERMVEVADSVDEDVADTGALNTISFADGRSRGHNTDVDAIRVALRSSLAPGCALAGTRGAVLGTGGSARAAAVALLREGVELRLLGRSRDRIREFARARGMDVSRLSADVLAEWQPSVVVHCTPVGTAPAARESLLPDWDIGAGTLVLDLVYNPPETALLARARRASGRPVSGLAVFLLQAADQIRLWTGQRVDPAALAAYLGPVARDYAWFAKTP